MGCFGRERALSLSLFVVVVRNGVLSTPEFKPKKEGLFDDFFGRSSRDIFLSVCCGSFFVCFFAPLFFSFFVDVFYALYFENGFFDETNYRAFPSSFYASRARLSSRA